MTCKGCNSVVEEEAADAVRAAMMTHGYEARSNHFDGKGFDEMRQRVDARLRQMIADLN